MKNSVQDVARNALAEYASVLHPQAVCIRTPFPARVSMSECGLSVSLESLIGKYEPKSLTEGLFPHQAAFFRAFCQDGKQDFIITTATGSGKSLCFWAWVLDHLSRDRESTALLCFPTQALMWGQAERMRRMSNRESLVFLPGSKAAVSGKIDFPGDDLAWTIWQGVGTGATYNMPLDEYQKSAKFERARIRIATLDKAHFSLFTWETGKRFAARLKCIVLDEAHTYDGVFGANAHYFLRRLYLASRIQESPRPHVFLASATLSAARRFAATLTSRPEDEITHIEDKLKQEIELISVEDVPELLSRPAKGEMVRVVLLLDDQGNQSTVTTLLEDLDLIGTKVNSIYFSQSKFHSKLLARRLASNGDGRQVIIYDADLPPDKRRELESRLNAPSAQGLTVLGTNALELGVDIEGLDVCLIDRTPPRRAALLQRIGRVGRRVNRPGLVLLRLSAEPHDRDMIESPAEAFRLESNRPLPVPLHLEMIKWRHMLAAFSEWSWDLKQGYISWDTFNAALREYFGASPMYADLKSQFDERFGMLVDTSDRAWVHQGFRAAASEGKIPLRCGKEEVARIDDVAVFRDAHPGAVFLGHDLKHYRVVAYEGTWVVAKWENPDSETILGKWLKGIDEIRVVPCGRPITTRGSWREEFRLREADTTLDRAGRPRRGAFKFGVWDYIRSWQGYTEIDLETGKSRKVSMQEATQEFAEALASGGKPPFLYPFSYRTVGWEWDFGKLELPATVSADLEILSQTMAGLLEHFLAAAVESKLEDISVELDVNSHKLRVLDGTPGGNGLSEALLIDNRVVTALAACRKELRKYAARGKKTKFKKYLAALRLEPPAGGVEEIADVVQQLHVRWAG